MKVPSLLNCVLLGALAGSMAFNMQMLHQKPAVASSVAPLAGNMACCPDHPLSSPEIPGLSESQIQQMAVQCGEACDRVRGLEQEADIQLNAIWEAVADPSVPWGQVHDMMEKTIRLRHESLKQSVTAALVVRDAVPHDWVRQIWDHCQESCLLKVKPKISVD